MNVKILLFITRYNRPFKRNSTSNSRKTGNHGDITNVLNRDLVRNKLSIGTPNTKKMKIFGL